MIVIRAIKPLGKIFWIQKRSLFFSEIQSVEVGFHVQPNPPTHCNSEPVDGLKMKPNRSGQKVTLDSLCILQPLAMFSQEQFKASQPFQDANQNFKKRSQYVCHQNFYGKQSHAATMASLCFRWVGSEETIWALVMEQTGLLCRSFLFICLSTVFKQTWPDMQIVPSSFSLHPILNFYGSSDDMQLLLFFQLTVYL